MRLISNEVENYGNTPVEWWLTAFYTGRNLEKDPDGVLYRFHLSHNDLDGLACHVVSTVYDCALNRFEIPLDDMTDALQFKNWEEIHVAHRRMPIQHSICKAGAKNVAEALHEIFESCCRSVFYKPVGPKDQIILLITDLGGITDSMFDEFYDAYGDRFQAIVIDHHLSTTPDRGKCDPNQIFWYVTGYQEGNLQSATKNLFTATCGSYNAAHPTSTTSGRASKKQERFVKQLTEYVEAVSKYDTGRWGEWLDRKTPDDVDLSVQHQLFFNNISWDSSADIFRRVLISKYVQDMIYLLSTEDYVHTNRAYWEIVRGNLNELHKEFYDMRQLTLAYNPHLTLTLKIDPIDGVYNPATRHTIRLGDITTNVQPVNNPLHPLVTFGIIELRKDQGPTKEWKYFSLCSRELMKKYMLDLFILVDEPNGTVSLRSMDNHGFEINCANIAWRNGGGGHKRAAGYPIPKVEVPEDADTDTENYDADADDLEDDTEEAEDGGTVKADADAVSEDSDEELIPNTSIGTHVHWAGNDWIVTHVDLKMVYMTLADVVPEWHVTWDDLQEACYEWAKKTFSAEELKKLVPITCGNTHGKVWVVSKRLMETGLAYFAESEEHRAASCRYWTSTEYSNVSAWNVDANGDIFELNGIKTCQHGFRPSICMLRSNFGPEDRTVGHYENAEIVKGCRTLIATGMQIMWANQRWIVSNIRPEIIMLTLAHSIPDLMDWEDLQDACNAWGNENLGDQKSKLAYLVVGGIYGKVFVATKSDMDGGFDYFKDDDKRCLGECYWTSTKDADGTTYYVDETGKIQSVSGQEMCSDIAPKFTFRPTVAIWTKEFCNDQGVKVVSE